jgi:hypothetical protein
LKAKAEAMSELFITYQNALKKFGEPHGGSPLPNDILESYRGRIPDSFIDFLALHTAGKWLQGYFQFCNPSEYRSVLDLVLKGDQELRPERTHALGFSAFGDILAWNEHYRILEINMIYGRVSCAEIFSPKPDIDPKITLGIAIGSVNAESYDNPDEHGKPMFKRLLRAHGELEVGQIYAPKLHPSLGGAIAIDNFRPAGALAAMTIAAQATPFTLYNTTIPSVPAIREVGA